MWIHQNKNGRARIYGREKSKGSGCVNRSTFLYGYEAQVVENLGRFMDPDDLQVRIMNLYRNLGHRETEANRRE